MAQRGVDRGQPFSVSSKTRTLHKASSSQVQSKRRWFYIECVADLGKLLLKDVVDARTISGLNKKLKYLEEKSTEEPKYGETPSGSENPLT